MIPLDYFFLAFILLLVIALLVSWDSIVNIVSYEFILTPNKRANSGSIVLLRSLLISSTFYLIGLVLYNLLGIWDSTRVCSFSRHELVVQIADSIHMFGAIFGAVYLGLYSRFASQWAYLANLYNKIKETQAKTADVPQAQRFIDGWKAGFIEDAFELHLATKTSFVPTINAWLKEPQVTAELEDKNHSAYSPETVNRMKTLINKRFDTIKKELELKCKNMVVK
jgi:hypothetical protein